MHSQQPSLLRKHWKYINSHEFEKVSVSTFQFLPATRKQDVTFSERLPSSSESIKSSNLKDSILYTKPN